MRASTKIPITAIPKNANILLELLTANRTIFVKNDVPESIHRFIFLNMKLLVCLPSCGLRNFEHITGLNVRATTVDMMTDTAIVTVN